MMTSPWRQSTSASSSAATSPARSPRRTSRVSTAKSRRPNVLRRSQLANKRATSGRPNAVGRPARRHPATLGTAASSWPLVWPSTNRKRSSDRSPHTTYLADPTVRAVHSASTKPVTSAASFETELALS